MLLVPFILATINAKLYNHSHKMQFSLVYQRICKAAEAVQIGVCVGARYGNPSSPNIGRGVWVFMWIT